MYQLTTPIPSSEAQARFNNVTLSNSTGEFTVSNPSILVYSDLSTSSPERFLVLFNEVFPSETRTAFITIRLGDIPVNEIVSEQELYLFKDKDGTQVSPLPGLDSVKKFLLKDPNYISGNTAEIADPDIIELVNQLVDLTFEINKESFNYLGSEDRYEGLVRGENYVYKITY